VEIHPAALPLDLINLALAVVLAVIHCLQLELMPDGAWTSGARTTSTWSHWTEGRGPTCRATSAVARVAESTT
jgi:hypothetical protein